MISLIIKSYFTILVSIGVCSLGIFVLGLYFILRKSASSQTTPYHATQVTEDLSAIAGDDLMVTQLDLARAYIETDRKSLAKQILESVLVQGTDVHQAEARRLLNIL